KAVAKVKKDGDDDAHADGEIDLSQLEDVTDEDEASDKGTAVAAEPQAAETDVDRRVEQTVAHPQSKIPSTGPEQVAIQPVQQQAGQQGSTSHQQMSDAD